MPLQRQRPFAFQSGDASSLGWRTRALVFAGWSRRLEKRLRAGIQQSRGRESRAPAADCARKRTPLSRCYPAHGCRGPAHRARTLLLEQLRLKKRVCSLKQRERARAELRRTARTSPRIVSRPSMSCCGGVHRTERGRSTFRILSPTKRKPQQCKPREICTREAKGSSIGRGRTRAYV